MRYLLILAMLLCVGCEKRPNYDDFERMRTRALSNDHSCLRELADHYSRLHVLEGQVADINDRPCEVYDPNAPEFGFLQSTDPNWVRDYGDSEDTRRLFNISVNRVRGLRVEKITALIAKRLIAIERLISDPNEVARKISDTELVAEVREVGDKSPRPLQNDPNEVVE